MEREQWKSLMYAFGFEPNEQTYAELLAAHQSKGRYYHSDVHISACLRHLESVQNLVKDWKILALAFWFHDSVYQPFSTTNERDSADWAMRFLTVNEASQGQIERIEALIMATCHNGKATDSDMQILIDIDLSILGAGSNVYAEYEKNIRKEYRKVPKFIFKKKRKEILARFLAQPKIYGSDHFYGLLEEQARINLKWAIAAL